MTDSVSPLRDHFSFLAARQGLTLNATRFVQIT